MSLSIKLTPHWWKTSALTTTPSLRVRTGTQSSITSNSSSNGDFSSSRSRRSWTRDLAIPVQRSNQLSYEATEVGSWSFLSSNLFIYLFFFYL